MLDLFEQRHPWLAARFRDARLFLGEVEVLGICITYPGSVSGPIREPDEEVLHGHEDRVEGCLAQRRASFHVYTPDTKPFRAGNSTLVSTVEGWQAVALLQATNNHVDFVSSKGLALH